MLAQKLMLIAIAVVVAGIVLLIVSSIIMALQRQQHQPEKGVLLT